MRPNKKILLSFDVEEFDCPLEYGREISLDEQLRVGYRGLMEIGGLLEQTGRRFTLFTTAFFAENFSNDIRSISENHEIASHTYFHSAFSEEHLGTSKEKLETITGKPVYGLRMPRMRSIDPAIVSKAGYSYDSSINPTWIPGRYNNRSECRTLVATNGIVKFPVSVTPRLRIPLFWLAFKNMPYNLYLRLALQTLRKDGYLCLYFHPWEFTDISNYKLPFYIKRGNKKALLLKFKRLLIDLSAEGEFTGMNDFIS